MPRLWPALLLCLAACAAPARPTPAPAPTDVVAEARAFMDAYAQAIRTGDRAAIGALYHRDGAHILGNGRKETLTFDSIGAIYRSPQWSPPAAFEWRDFSYEPVGPDAVVLAGIGHWTPRAGQPPLVLSYTGLLRRQDGALRIRVEDESFAPPR